MTSGAQVTSLNKQGVQKIVLDLRGVAAGSLAEGVAVANLFIKDGDLAKVIGRENKVVTTYTADPSKAVFDGNLAVLIDLGTAGAAEVVASAVLDAKTRRGCRRTQLWCRNRTKAICAIERRRLPSDGCKMGITQRERHSSAKIGQIRRQAVDRGQASRYARTARGRQPDRSAGQQ